MYLIVENKPYAIRNNKVYEVAFGEKGTIKLGNEVDIAIEGKTYTYDEISRKYNLKAKLQAKNEPTKELVDELNQKINSLLKENEELKKQLKVEEPKVEEVKEEVVEEQPIEEEIVEEVKENKTKKNK